MKRGSIDLVTSAGLQESENEGGFLGLDLKVLHRGYFFQGLLVKVSHKDSLDSKGRQIESTFSQKRFT